MDAKPIRETVAILATVIGEIMEDHVHEALTVSKRDTPTVAADLTVAGSDIAVLANAMTVLLRRADPE